MKIALYGGGGLGHELAAEIRGGNINDSGNWDLIGFFDDKDLSHSPEDRLLGNWLGGIDALNHWEEPLGLILSIGNPKARYAIVSKVTNPLVSFPNCIAKDYRITDAESFRIGKGNVINGNCLATSNISIGNFNLLNGSVVFGHDVKIGNANVFMPGCRISGEVAIGDRNLFGAMSFVKQCLTVKDDFVLSPLSALLTSPKPNSTYIGNPAKIFKY